MYSLSLSPLFKTVYKHQQQLTDKFQISWPKFICSLNKKKKHCILQIKFMIPFSHYSFPVISRTHFSTMVLKTERRLVWLNHVTGLYLLHMKRIILLWKLSNESSFRKRISFICRPMIHVENKKHTSFMNSVITDKRNIWGENSDYIRVPCVSVTEYHLKVTSTEHCKRTALLCME